METGIFTIEADSKIQDISGIPMRNPEFSDEALILRSSIARINGNSPSSSRGRAISSVPTERFATYISDAYNISAVDDNNSTYRFTKADIEDRITMDTFGRLLEFSGARFNNMSLRDIVPPLALEPEVDLSIVSNDEVHKIFELPSSNIPFNQSLSVIRLPNDTLRFGHISSTMSQNMLISLTSELYRVITDVYAAYASTQIGALVHKVEYKPMFANKPFYRRDTDFNEYFVEYKLDSGITRFIFNPYSYSTLKDKLDTSVLDDLNRGELFIQKAVLHQLTEYIKVKVSYWYRTYNKKNVMMTIKKYLSGELKLSDIKDMEVNQALASVMRHMTDAVSDNLAEDSTILILVIISEYIKMIKHLESRKGTLVFEAEHFEETK